MRSRGGPREKKAAASRGGREYYSQVREGGKKRTMSGEKKGPPHIGLRAPMDTAA